MRGILMDKLTINDEVSLTADGYYAMLSTSCIPDLRFMLKRTWERLPYNKI